MPQKRLAKQEIAMTPPRNELTGNKIAIIPSRKHLTVPKMHHGLMMIQLPNKIAFSNIWICWLF
jgi:hypothetical protein